MNIQAQIEHALALDAKIRRLQELEYTCQNRRLYRLVFLAQNSLADVGKELEEFNQLADTTLLAE